MAHAAPQAARIYVLTVSDTRTEETDESGKACRELAEGAGHAVVGSGILPDDPVRVGERVKQLCAVGDIDAVLINGGTGISARDTTYEAVSSILQKRLDGFGELFRMLSFAEIGSKAMASRAVAGVRGNTLIFSMPGSTRAVKLAMEKLIARELGHLTGELNK